MICDDINNISYGSVKQYIGDKEVDLIVGESPCQGSSVFGKRRFIHTQEYDPHTDPRNALVYQYIRLVQELKPKFFFMENVKGFTNLDKGLFVENVKKQFRDLGYEDIWLDNTFDTQLHLVKRSTVRAAYRVGLGLEIDWPQVQSGMAYFQNLL